MSTLGTTGTAARPGAGATTAAEALVVVLCKPPAAANCKTRLAADVGRAAATAIYERCLRAVVRSAAHTGAMVRFSVAGDPIELVAVARDHAPHADIMRQIGAEFAQRQCHEIARGLADGYHPVALVASDLARPPDEQLRWALRSAAGGAVAVVPSPDGGYSILASGIPLPELASVPMSSDRTCELLCHTLRQHGHRVEAGGRPLPDIDVAADLDRVAASVGEEIW